MENFSKAKKSAEVVDSSLSFIPFMSEDDVIPRARAQVNKSPRAGLPARNHLDTGDLSDDNSSESPTCSSDSSRDDKPRDRKGQPTGQESQR